jgi:hypothetical protein
MTRPGRRLIPAALSACALLAAVNPVAAQDSGTNDWSIGWPARIVPGQVAEVSGTTDPRCQEGTAEIGFDPAYNLDAAITGSDGRSNEGSSVTVPVGYFMTTLAIPDWATEGTLYGICSIGTDGRREIFSSAATSAPIDDSSEPVAGSSSWAVNLPSSVAPGGAVTLSGTTPDMCLPGTAEAGVDPGEWGVPGNRDPRSGQQTATSLTAGSFNVRLDIPADLQSTATRQERGGTVVQIYVLCETQSGEIIFESKSVFVSGGSGGSGTTTDGSQQATDGNGTTDGEAEADTPTDDDFRFELRDGDAQLAAAATNAGLLGIDPEDGLVLAAGVAPLADPPPQAVRVPSGARCNVSTCLWGYFAPPYYGCNQTVVIVNFGRSRYGSMTAYGYIRKGLADYVTARPLFYMDGQLIKTGSWEKKSFFYAIGQPWESWIGVKIHQQFASPQSVYQVAFQARWYKNVVWGRDKMIAATGRVSPVPYLCTAGP